MGGRGRAHCAVLYLSAPADSIGSELAHSSDRDTVLKGSWFLVAMRLLKNRAR